MVGIESMIFLRTEIGEGGGGGLTWPESDAAGRVTCMGLRVHLMLYASMPPPPVLPLGTLALGTLCCQRGSDLGSAAGGQCYLELEPPLLLADRPV